MTAALPRAPRWLLGLVLAAVAVRLAARLPSGAEAFVTHGYDFYLALSRNLLDGHGLCYSPGQGCAVRMPFYPLLLAPLVASGLVYPGAVLVQAAMGGALAWITWLLASELFDRRVAALAAVAAAFSPYSVMHDTALQDTVLVNALLAAAVLWLLVARRTGVPLHFVAAGTVLSLAVLTSARVALFLPLAVGWTAWVAGAGWRSRVRNAGLVLLPMAILLGGWAARNWRMVGAPVLTTEAGASLWFGNNPWTFDYFPERSIDLVSAEFDRVPAGRRAAIDALEHRDVDRDAEMGRLAREYMAAEPGHTLRGAARKVWVVASAQLSPARSPLTQAGFQAVYLPIHVLAVLGFWRARHHWRSHGPAWLLAVALLGTTAVFWAHTSHATYWHPILFTYAAAAGVMFLDIRRQTA